MIETDLPESERRTAEAYREGRWVRIPFRALRKGDVFRLFEANGQPVPDSLSKGQTYNVVLEDPIKIPMADGRWHYSIQADPADVIPKPKFRNPTPTVDIFLQFYDPADSLLKYVLVKRKNPPHGLALPGGFVDYGESCEDAAVREAKEELGVDIEIEEQFHTYSDPDRDPRQHVMTTVFLAFLKKGQTLKAGDDAAELVFVPRNFPAKDAVFDHAKIITDIHSYLREGKRPR